MLRKVFLVNASTCVIGGGVQVASSFIRGVCRAEREHVWTVLMSPEVQRECSDVDASGNVRLITVTPSPARLLTGISSRRLIRRVEREVRPDAVFTVFGPSYIRFSAPHVMGFASPFVLSDTSLMMQQLGVLAKAKLRMRRWYRTRRLRDAQEFVVETESAKARLSERLCIPASDIHVISNSCNAQLSAVAEYITPPPCGPVVNVLLMAADYPHKNHRILPLVASALLKRGSASIFRFLVTLPSTSSTWEHLSSRFATLGLADSIVNLGPIAHDDLIHAYAQSDIVFHPSLAEVFSATYLEAMLLGRPLVVTRLDFAEEICRNAALYFDPCDPEEAADRLIALRQHPDALDALRTAGRARVLEFPTADAKFNMQLQLVVQFADRRRRHGGTEATKAAGEYAPDRGDR